MVGDLASLLNARSDVGDQLRLRAVAGEVSQTRASIAGQGRDEAVELAFVSGGVWYGCNAVHTEQAGTSGS